MTTPGWYHANGDPVGTHRYWDGTQWQGEPAVPAPANEVIYYPPAEGEIDLGDTATRISLKETDPTHVYRQSPYSATKSSVNVTRRKQLPEGLKNLTILVCVLKAIPLLSMIASVLASFGRSTLSGPSRGRFDPPGLSYGTASATAILIAIVVLFAALVVSQGHNAIKDRASNLFAVALVMLALDVLNATSQWVADGVSAGSSLLATLILVLQSMVTVWAGIQARLS